MLDLINGYLIIIIALFSTNLGLFHGNKTNKIPLRFILISIFLYVVFIISQFLEFDLGNVLSYIFICLSLVNFIIFYCYLKNSRNLIFIIIMLFYITVLLLSSQAEFSYFNSLLYALTSLVIMYVSYQFSKLLFHAKREYPIIVGEYMVLSSLLIFILGLTYWAVKTLDYGIFSPFLILTPTYQLIYIIIIIAVILIIGSYLNDKMR